MSEERSVADRAPLDRFSRPLRDLRISVTDRCNFRCPYCMPAEVYGERYRFLPYGEILTFEEITRLAGLFVGLGARKLRLTGGEPLLRADLPKLVAMLAALPGVEDLALTTNGHLLARHAELLARAGLRRVTVSLDSHDEAVFQRMSGGFSSPVRVLEGIAAAERAGLTPIKINCVVERGANDHTVVDLARHFRGTGHIVRFIEYMDVGTRNAWELAKVVPAREIVERIDAELPLEPAEPNYRGEVARRWRYRDGGGEIGVIASVSQPFCGDCTRARLSAKGELVTCLFASAGRDLRGPLRAGASDDELLQHITGTWRERVDRYSEERSHRPLHAARRLEMYQLGG
jgi:cyclic pyranopterin phosphate synthase